ncbi:MAG: hypothetical protein D6725_03740, partial [Planctomycetota bacterium]
MANRGVVPLCRCALLIAAVGLAAERSLPAAQPGRGAHRSAVVQSAPQTLEELRRRNPRSRWEELKRRFGLSGRHRSAQPQKAPPVP